MFHRTFASPTYWAATSISAGLGPFFFNSYAARMAPSGKDATYAHELAHLLTWRYRSHTLREGLADYLALQLHPAASVGPNRKGHEVDAAQVPALEGLLGTSAEPPAALMSDQGFRRSYYAASYRFVRVLIRRGGLALFLDLYRAQDPDGAYSACTARPARPSPPPPWMAKPTERPSSDHDV